MSEQIISWHQGAVIYQIYPRSFYDTSGTGVGNLRGIIEKFDYLAALGINAIWISPIYTSPMADFGYDVADYQDIDPLFGNLDDFKLLLKEAHRRNIKVILDFVPNHTSDEHTWFTESRSSRDNPHRDWYIWRDPKPDGGPPNNWLSVFGGSAWQYSEETKQFYLHSFLSKQPDLNWDNSEVRETMKSTMRFWLNLDIDGFRVDAVDWLSKDSQFRDDPENTLTGASAATDEHRHLKHVYSQDGPRLYERLNELTEVLGEYKDKFMITEAHPETDNMIGSYLKHYQGVNPQLSSPFNFEGIYLPWEALKFRKFVDEFQAIMLPRYTPIYTVGNHDESRIASRIGTAAARTAAMMLLTLPGMCFIYYGEELGMTDVPIAADQLRDPLPYGKGRDPQRTPMLWDSSQYAGFTTGDPWLPVSPNFSEINAKVQSKDPESILNLYRQLIRFRNRSIVLKQGAYHSVDCGDDVFCYERSLGDDVFMILLNFIDAPQDVIFNNLKGVIQLSTYLDLSNKPFDEHASLRPNEGLIIKVIK